ncbi:DUF4342 domain-containing protein [Mucilaginibacter myungsuensis]|uniref:DUF4342 domain-containing protein n=1 Tax=Mucilaginibacter myungsuensis TaxID=649104 RepID=A0A929KVN7_9SPHI|nr:DUF4342 domain-containing protein [Mucilaginibacter myungsuensis]MBE9660743.1 DUF4342 domain-containing protein [Mucilaginibacter myungsuensis]MDN3600788.1 DUF4342 domain-containing protein [Mucilaginibacter myungsuensis]
MPIKESFNISGESLLKKIKEIIADGNATKITISDKSGKELISFPLTYGLVGVLLAPVLAAVGALAALVVEVVVTVERPDKAEPEFKSEEVKAEEI